MVIIGIDPGSCITGFGVIHIIDNHAHYLDSGCLRVAKKEVATRLQEIHSGLSLIHQKYKPAEAAIEQVFMHHNVSAALKLGQARGAAMAALTIPVFEYTARQVKQSVVGFGAATKEQIQHMVCQILNIQTNLQADEADALAIALCHAHIRVFLNKIGVFRKRQKKNSWRQYQS